MDAIPPADPPHEPNPFKPPRTATLESRRPEYRPLPILGQIAGRLAVLLAGVIAFAGTCIPIGAAAFNRNDTLFGLAWVIGFAAATLAGSAVYGLIFQSRWRRLPPEQEADR